MVLIPCVDGVNHSPREQASAEDITLASDVLRQAIRWTDELLACELRVGSGPPARVR